MAAVASEWRLLFLVRQMTHQHVSVSADRWDLPFLLRARVSSLFASLAPTQAPPPSLLSPAAGIRHGALRLAGEEQPSVQAVLGQ